MIVVDWGTTHLRAFRLTASGDVEARKSVPKGIMSVAPGAFATALEEVLEDWLQLSDGPILMSGMIGSRQGWFEVPYVECPAGRHELAAGIKRVPWTTTKKCIHLSRFGLPRQRRRSRCDARRGSADIRRIDGHPRGRIRHDLSSRDAQQ